jgi:hypothetical protein
VEHDGDCSYHFGDLSDHRVVCLEQLKGEKLMASSDITVKQERRLCVVNGKMGYFHCWEHYSRPVEPSPMIGGAPGGVISFVRAIVEFPEGIGYVDPKDLKFRDEENVYLHRLQKIEDMRKEKKNVRTDIEGSCQ